MHKNTRFNILQAPGNCNRNFVVIDGQRTDSGHPAHGAKVLTGEMSRDEAIQIADSLQADAEAEQADMDAKAARLRDLIGG